MKYTVVVAEDEELLLNNLVQKIQKADPDFQVTGTAQTGEQAFALVIIDHNCCTSRRKFQGNGSSDPSGSTCYNSNFLFILLCHLFSPYLSSSHTETASSQLPM